MRALWDPWKILLLAHLWIEFLIKLLVDICTRPFAFYHVGLRSKTISFYSNSWPTIQNWRVMFKPFNAGIAMMISIGTQDEEIGAIVLSAFENMTNLIYLSLTPCTLCESFITTCDDHARWSSLRELHIYGTHPLKYMWNPAQVSASGS